MGESNETSACQIKKTEINRSPENNPTPQPQTQIIINRGADFVAIFTSIKTILSINISVRTVISTDTRRDSVRAVNDDRIQATGEATIRINVAKRMAY
ncbi:hypothetical protein ACTXT7_016390 [Hymenolepis weldensis]